MMLMFYAYADVYADADFTLMLMITLMLLMILTMMGIKFIDKHDSLAKVLDFAKSTKPIKLLQRDKN